MFSSEDAAKLKKIGCNDLLDLALFIPKGYENLFLSKTLQPGLEHVLDVAFSDIRKERRVLKVYGEMVDFGIPVELVYFNYSSWHVKTFHEKKQLFLKGKLESRAGSYQLIQPKWLDQVNTITCKYATRSLKAVTIDTLKSRYLKEENLLESGVPSEMILPLMEIHFPVASSVQHYQKMGGYSGQHLKALKFIDIYRYLKQLSKKKRTFQAKTRLSGDIAPFIEKLPFALTNDQKNAIEAIRRDLDSDLACKRVVVGDVGCGKTMVILASVMMAYPKKVLLMAPTTILANQLHEEAKKHLPEYVTKALLTQENKKIPTDVHLLIGTHALLYTDISDADLIMIDEQHRFGTNQRALLEKLSSEDGKRPHVVQFSATPIPRTMAMIESSLVDFSFIREIPFPKDIDTEIIGKAYFPKLLQHIRNEITKGHQVIIVYPLVEESENIDYLSIDEAESFWKKQFDNVYVTHGKDKEKEKVLMEFREKGSILLSTTVIEVGISLPNLTTIVISGAERLGLATLHQLRGRVSRNGLKGYCYLFTNLKESKRLSEFSKTVNGFEIAELDLKYRDSGDLLSGSRQSGKQFEWIDLSEDAEIIQMAKERLAL